MVKPDNQQQGDSSLLVDISDALSERDRVRFTVHTRTKLPQFAKQNMSVVRQHEEFIWLHDCLEDNDTYAGYIIPPAPPRPDFDASREKLQRLGDSESNMTKEEFAKMKQELEAEYLAIFKKTVAMHEVFLQRLASHEKFRLDDNFKIFLEYENELAVKCKSKRERITGTITKSLNDFVIQTSQAASATSAVSSLLLSGTSSPNTATTNNTNNDTIHPQSTLHSSSSLSRNGCPADSTTAKLPEKYSTVTTSDPNTTGGSDGCDEHDPDDINEQYFEKERILLALYLNSIQETASQADKVCQVQKSVADTNLYLSQQLVKLASIEVLPIKAQTKDSSNFATLATMSAATTSSGPNNSSGGGCANNHTSEGLKQLLLNVSDYFEQARKVEARIASDEDLKLTDTFRYYKRDTVAAQDLLVRRLRFLSDLETATKNLEKSRQKGRTQMQFADVIQKQAKENFVSISKLAKQEMIEYKKRRAAAMKKAFRDLADLELKHLRSHSQLIKNCLNICNGVEMPKPAVAAPTSSNQPTAGKSPSNAPTVDTNSSGSGVGTSTARADVDASSSDGATTVVQLDA